MLPVGRPMAKQFTLGKDERLKSRKQIEQLFTKGKKFSISSFQGSLSIQCKLTNPPLQFGAGVSNKNFKKAVDRNRIKRLIREAYRLQKNELQEKLKEQKRQLNVFFIYTGKELPVYNEHV